MQLSFFIIYYGIISFSFVFHLFCTFTDLRGVFFINIPLFLHFYYFAWDVFYQHSTFFTLLLFYVGCFLSTFHLFYTFTILRGIFFISTPPFLQFYDFTWGIFPILPIHITLDLLIIIMIHGEPRVV